MTPLLLQVSVGGGIRLLLGDTSARLPSISIKNLHMYLFTNIEVYSSAVYLPQYRLCQDESDGGVQNVWSY